MIDPDENHQDVGSDLVVLGEILEAVLLGDNLGLGLDLRFRGSRHVLVCADETLDLPLGESDLFHPGRPFRPCRERPRCRRTADERDELAPPHSITSSASARSIGGTSRPSVLAVLRLITSSNFVGCSTGMSPGFSPFKILSTSSAARR